MTKNRDHDAPLEKSARKPVPTLGAKSKNDTTRRHQNHQNQQPTTTVLAASNTSTLSKSIDPRFSTAVYHGTAIKQNLEKQYAFLGEMAAKEQKERETRLRALRREQRYREKELKEKAREAERIAALKRGKKLLKKKQQPSKANDESDDNHDNKDKDEEKDDENNDDGDDEDDEEIEGLDPDDRIRIALMKDLELQDEVAKLRKEVNHFKMKRGERHAREKRDSSRRTWAQQQVAAVKSGKQLKPFFANKKQMKIQTAKDELRDAAKSGGHAATNSLMEKKLKKKVDLRHMTR